MRKLIIYLSSLVLSAIVFGQDIHYSQYFQNAISLNPALTGVFKEDYRVSVIHRNQWTGINSSFVSSTAGFEMNIKEGKLINDVIGIGVYGVNDRLGEGVIRTNGIYFSGSYRHTMDHDKLHHLSIGAQFGYITKSIDPSGFQFGNQYEHWVFNGGLPHFEDLSNLSVGYVDMELGTQYWGRLNEYFAVSSGLSLFQVTTPLESLSVDSLKTYSIGSRVLWAGGVEYKLNEQWTLYPKIMMVYQKGAGEVSFGALAGYDLKSDENFIAYTGVFGRAKDALIYMAGVKYKNIELMGSYDMTTSNLRNLEGVDGVTRSGIGNAFEVSMNFLGVLNNSVPAKFTVPCGIF